MVCEYLLKCGAETVGTVKRMAGCWPFTYDQKVSESDARRLIDPKGAATLFLKRCKAGSKYLFASAFRNGSGSVATAISTFDSKFQWEGVVLNHSEFERYRADDTSLACDFFTRIGLGELLADEEEEDEEILLKNLREETILPMTLRQGK